MDENLGSSDLGTPESLSSAVESIRTEAPKLSGLDKLKAAKEFVEKNDSLPPKSVPADPKLANANAPVKPAANVPIPAVKTAASPLADPNAPVTPYQADFKYKAGGKELEIPEKFRALITDKESEEEVKKLFGQAATLEEFKTTNQALKKNLGDVGGALNQFQGGVQKLRSLVQKNDFDGFFQGMNIPQEKIFQWVLDKVQYNQLPPEQRAQIDAQRNLQLQNEMVQNNLSQASQRELNYATQVKGLQLDNTLGRADVKTMSDAFDSRVGRPGAFKEAIIEHGKAVWALSGQKVDLTPEQAIADFVQKYGNPSVFAGQNPAAGAATLPANTPNPTGTLSANAAPPVKVIPNVAGRSTSPIKQKPKNLEDLKRLRDEAIRLDNANRSPSQGYLAG